MKTQITVAGVRLIRSTYLGDPAWVTERDKDILFYQNSLISIPPPRGQRLRSGRVYRPKWVCIVKRSPDGNPLTSGSTTYPYNGAWFDTITEIINRLDRDGYFDIWRK